MVIWDELRTSGLIAQFGPRIPPVPRESPPVQPRLPLSTRTCHLPVWTYQLVVPFMDVNPLLKEGPSETLLQRISHVAVLDSPKMSSQQTCIPCFSVEVIHSKQRTGTEMITEIRWKDLNNQQEKSACLSSLAFFFWSLFCCVVSILFLLCPLISMGITQATRFSTLE